jgi:hypothetical protein
MEVSNSHRVAILLAAAKANKAVIMELLMESPVNTSDLGLALLAATEMRHTKVAETLLSAGADVEVMDSPGEQLYMRLQNMATSISSTS